ncbi:hypothetical protein ASF16_09365 [Acidovorax sp. Leaf78]|nr:hypothetical protein ASF16_09365 [Acidovorax sp. Leaf78]
MPLGTLGDLGVTSIDTSLAAVTVRLTGCELRLPILAVIAAVPLANVEARPVVPAALLIVATAGLLDDQVTWLVSTCVV